MISTVVFLAKDFVVPCWTSPSPRWRRSTDHGDGVRSPIETLAWSMRNAFGCGVSFARTCPRPWRRGPQERSALDSSDAFHGPILGHRCDGWQPTSVDKEWSCCLRWYEFGHSASVRGWNASCMPFTNGCHPRRPRTLSATRR